MEELVLTKKQINTIKTTYILSILIAIAFLCFFIFLSNKYDMFFKLYFDHIMDAFYNLGLMLMVLSIIICWNKIRRYIIPIGFFICSLLPLFKDGDLGLTVPSVIGSILAIIAVNFINIYFFWLFIKKIRDKKQSKKIIKIWYVIYLIYLLSTALISVIYNYINGLMNIEILVFGGMISIFFPLLFGFIAYKGMIDEGFYKNFIEAHPLKLLKSHS